MMRFASCSWGGRHDGGAISPRGVGMGFTPPKWLRAGDVVKMEINGAGVIENVFQ